MRIDLHLGVHKTATTHLQRYWHASSQESGATAVCPPLADVRLQLTPVCSPPVKGRSPSDDAAKREAASAWLKQCLQAGRPLLISDENLLGSCERIFALRTLYPSALQRLQRLAEVLAGHEVRVWLAVREYADFLRSAYSEMLRHGPYRPFREAFGGLSLHDRGWEHIAADIRAAFPKAEFRCWRYEALHSIRGPVSSMIFDLDPRQLPIPDDERDRRSMSRLAIRLLDDMYQRMSPEEATRARPSVERVLSGAGMQPFDPWEEAEREYFAKGYERSLAALHEMSGVTWIG